MQPVPFILDKPLEDLYATWESRWLNFHDKLPTKKDIKDFDKDLSDWKEIVYPEWVEALEPYITSENPAHKYFALFVLCWFATD